MEPYTTCIVHSRGESRSESGSRQRLAVIDHDLRSLASVTQSQADPSSLAHLPSSQAPGIIMACYSLFTRRGVTATVAEKGKSLETRNTGAYDPVACIKHISYFTHLPPSSKNSSLIASEGSCRRPGSRRRYRLPVLRICTCMRKQNKTRLLVIHIQQVGQSPAGAKKKEKNILVRFDG